MKKMAARRAKGEMKMPVRQKRTLKMPVRQRNLPKAKKEIKELLERHPEFVDAEKVLELYPNETTQLLTWYFLDHQRRKDYSDSIRNRKNALNEIYHNVDKRFVSTEALIGYVKKGVDRTYAVAQQLLAERCWVYVLQGGDDRMPGRGLGDPDVEPFKFKNESFGPSAPAGGEARCTSGVNECLRTPFVDVKENGCHYCDQHGCTLPSWWVKKYARVYITITDTNKQVIAYIEAGAIKELRDPSNRENWRNTMNQLDHTMIAKGNIKASHSVAVLGM